MLVDAADALDRAHVVSVLGAQIAGVFGLDLPVGLFLFPRSLQRPHLIFSENQVFLSGFSFQSFEPFAKGLQWRSQTQRTPAGEISIPRLARSLAALAWP